MGKTIRKGRDGKKYKESLKKKVARYKCRCQRCVGKNKEADKISEKDFKEQIKIDEYNFKHNGEFIEDIDDPYYTNIYYNQKKL